MDHLRNKLRDLKDYDEIKRELDIMKVCCYVSYIHALCSNRQLQYVEFSGFDVNDDDEDDHLTTDNDNDWYLPSPNAGKSNVKEGKSLEALLATKNKRLQEELTKLRVNTTNSLFICCNFSWSTCRFFMPNLKIHYEASANNWKRRLKNYISKGS